VCTKSFNFIAEHSRKILWTSPFDPSNKVLDKKRVVSFVRFLVHLLAMLWFAQTWAVKCTSQKVELKTRKGFVDAKNILISKIHPTITNYPSEAEKKFLVLAFANRGQNENQNKIWTNSTRSQWHFPVNWLFTHDKIDMTYFFSEYVLDMSLIQLLEIFCLSFWSIWSKLQKDSYCVLGLILNSIGSKWQSCRFPNNSPYFRALFQSNKRITRKISKS